MSDSLGNKISKYLHKYHRNRYMIWNLSEKSYDTALFNDSVIEFKFPGYPSPPLQQMFELLSSIDNWLHSKLDNIAIIHCQTGKGRTVTVISAYLAWSKYNNFTPAKGTKTFFLEIIKSEKRFCEIKLKQRCCIAVKSWMEPSKI